MSPDQQFTIALLGVVAALLAPFVTGVLTIVGGVVLFRQNQAVKASADAAAAKSEKAEQAANHSKDTAAAMRADFKAVVDALKASADAMPAEVVVVNPESAPVPVVAPKGTGR